jgi:GDP-4-dehydro-6-deoxy-D-mannose reductase
MSTPDYVVHLAAQSFVGSSWQTPAETLTTNISSQVNLLEGIRALKMRPRFLAVGTSEEYGLTYPEELPIKETNPLRPLSPYAVSKVTQDMMGYQYFKSYGLPIIRTRAFNHEGPRRGEVFVTSNFAKQIAEIEAGVRDPVIHVGDLKPRRDYSDVRDIVRGYWSLLESGEPGEVYNLSSGRSWAIQQVLDFLLEQSKVRPIAVEVDPARLRPSDVMLLEGDSSKIRRATGWQVEIPFERTLRELLDYWRQRIRAAHR